MASLLYPLLSVGSAIGVIFNHWIPDSFIFFMQTTLLILVSVTTGQKFVKARNEYLQKLRTEEENNILAENN